MVAFHVRFLKIVIGKCNHRRHVCFIVFAVFKKKKKLKLPKLLLKVIKVTTDHQKLPKGGPK